MISDPERAKESYEGHPGHSNGRNKTADYVLDNNSVANLNSQCNHGILVIQKNVLLFIRY